MRGATRLATGMLNILLPPRCLSCRALVDRPGSLCGACWREVDFIETPFCAGCGWPFDFDEGHDVLCGACAARSPGYDRGRAVLRYHDRSRRMILGFKHGDRLDAAPAFGQWMRRAGRELFEDCHFIAPVPLHRRRLFARRYNQSAVLAHALSRETGIPVAADLLVRVRATPSQAGRSRKERVRNVRGAFKVRADGAGKVRGRKILLVDDVMTTGATVEACARVLKGAGAARVDVLTLARVVHPSQVPI
ncbi:MAG: double zinc ribbon domain-containing protein [Sphingomonadales bacterium]